MAGFAQEDDEKAERNGFDTSPAVADTLPSRPRYVHRVGYNSCHETCQPQQCTDDGALES
jgi:hypothetical protein